MALPITITDAGRTEIINAQNNGTGAVTITEIGFGTGQYTPTKTRTALQAQVKRVGSVAGQAVAADTIHVMALDESASSYNVGEFGLFSDKGTLIAVYSQPAAAGWIIQKAGPSTLLLATDIILESLDANSITFGDISFINPPASTTVQGVVELATPEETQAGTDGSRAVTPAGLKSLTGTTNRAGLVQLNNTLTSTSTAQALTAAQGKKLQDEKQPLDATLTALASLVTAANKLIYATGLDTFATADLSAFARTLLDDVNATAALATLGAAPLNSPGLTGAPTAPTPATNSNNTQLATTAFVKAVVAALVDSSPGTLDTLNELALALGNDPNFATTIANALALKANLASPTLTGDPKAPTPTATDNDTSIATTAFVRAALELFGLGTARLAYTAGVDANTLTTTGMYQIQGTNLPGGDTGTWFVRVDAAHDLAGRVTQEAERANVSAGDGVRVYRRRCNDGVWTQWQEFWHNGNFNPALKANLASPTFTGTPTAPTPAISTNNTQLATTAFVKAVVAALVDSSPGTLDTLNELALALGNDPNFATTIANALALKANLASPTLTGDPKAPTPSATVNDTSIATTAFVRAAMALFGLGSARVAYTAGIDANTLTTTGVYQIQGANLPGGDTGTWFVRVDAAFDLSGRVTQEAERANSSAGDGVRVYRRRCNDGVWTQWQEFWHNGNLKPPIGDGQAWLDVTSSRVVGITYTNTTGRPIQIFIDASDITSNPTPMAISISGIQWESADLTGGLQVFAPVSLIVPAGSSYRISGGINIRKWLELRS